MNVQAAILAAAIAYRCIVESTYPMPRTVAANVTADGARQRLEIPGDTIDRMGYDVLLSTNGGATYTAMNTKLKTWFGPVGALLPRDHGFAWHFIPGTRDVPVKKIVSSVTAENPHKFVGRLSFEAEMEMSVTLLVTTTDEAPFESAARLLDFSTGIQKVDAEWMPKLAVIHGFPVKIEMAITRHYEGGRPVTNLVTATVSDIHAIPAVPPLSFAVPNGYVHQAPVVSGPGVVKH